MEKKSVLLTNHNIVNFTGSEIDTITMAEYFLKHNYDVTIFTLKYGDPITNIINKKIKLIDFNNVHKLKPHYDLIWSHHFPLLDYLLFSQKITSDYIAYISLSAYESWESFPLYYKELNHLSILSKEALDLAKIEGYDIRNFHIFPNYSFAKYFTEKIHKNEKLKKICIISNHIPTELLEASDLLRKHNYGVDIYGMGHNYKKVDDTLLRKYDLIISIGKTINYGLSLGIPCYCYDRFGGDGYLNPNNVKKSFEYNFSGRYSHIKKSSQELYQDIINNYPTASENVEKLRKWAQDHFCYEKNMSKTLEQIYNTKKFSLENLLAKYPTEQRRSLLVRELSVRENTIEYINSELSRIQYSCKFYFDFGKGFNEKDSKTLVYTRLSEGKYYVELKVPHNARKILYNFIDRSLIRLKSLKINGEKIDINSFSNVVSLNNYPISLNNNSAIIFPVTNQSLKITIDIEPVTMENILINDEFQNWYLRQIKNKIVVKNIANKIIKKLSINFNKT